MTPTGRPRLTLGWWCLVLASAAVALAASGSGLPSLPAARAPSSWDAWLEANGPAPTAVALIRLAGLAFTAYLGAVTALGWALRVLGADRMVVLVDRLTVPALRRLLSAACGAGLFFSPLTAVQPALAQPAPVERTLTMHGLTDTPEAAPEDRHEAVPAAPGLTMRRLQEKPPPARAEAAPTVGRTVKVEAGQSFWSIAEDALEAAGRDTVTDSDVVPYWRQLIDVNRGRLADPGNPDLIFPGQVLTLPLP